MSKAEYMALLARIYRAANRPYETTWMPPAMAGDAGCGAIDQKLRAMVRAGAITEDERQAFYDTL